MRQPLAPRALLGTTGQAAREFRRVIKGRSATDPEWSEVLDDLVPVPDHALMIVGATARKLPGDHVRAFVPFECLGKTGPITPPRSSDFVTTVLSFEGTPWAIPLIWGLALGPDQYATVIRRALQWRDWWSDWDGRVTVLRKSALDAGGPLAISIARVTGRNVPDDITWADVERVAERL